MKVVVAFIWDCGGGYGNGGGGGSDGTEVRMMVHGWERWWWFRWLWFIWCWGSGCGGGCGVSFYGMALVVVVVVDVDAMVGDGVVHMMR